MQRLKEIDRWSAAALLTALILFATNIVRAAKQGFTIDEAFSFNRFIQPSLLEAWKYYDANHHVLLCLLSRALLLIFEPSEFILRLPVVLGGGLYLLASLATCRALAEGKWLLISYLALVLNPYILDYLSIARGYGLGLGLYMCAVAFIVHGNSLGRHTVKCGVLIGLSVASNLVFIIPSAALCIATGLVERGITRGKRLGSVLQLSLLATCVAISFLYAPMISASWKSFYFGSDTLYQTAESLYAGSLLHHPWIWEQAAYKMKTVLIVIGSALLSASCLTTFMPPKGVGRQGTVIVLTLFLSAALPVLLSVTARVHYPYGRTGIYLLPLMVLTIATGARRFTPLIQTGVTVLLLGLILCFTLEWNTRIYGDFAFDAGTKKMVELIARSVAARDRSGQGQVSVGSSWMYSETINYYRETRKLHWMKPVKRGDLSKQSDYYLLMQDDLGLLSTRHLVIVSNNLRTHQILAEDPSIR